MKLGSPSKSLLAACIALTTFAASQSPSLALDPATGLPLIRLYADPFKTLEPCPTCRVIPGVVIVERSGPTTEPLTVYLTVDGTATPGLDYSALPESVEIPAGQSSGRLTVGAYDDLLVEGPEIVRVRVGFGPAGTPPLYDVTAFQGDAMVVIGDDEPEAPEGRLDMVQPPDGSQVSPETIVRISALGVWTEGELDQGVQFYAGDQLIGQTFPPPFARAPIPCLPSVHTISWTNPPIGEHVLRARARIGLDGKLESPPVRLTVGPKPAATVVSIKATSPIAEESSAPLRRIALTGVLEISRTGPTDFALPVFVHYSGSAEAKDFIEAPPWLTTIPAGAASTEIRLTPFPDDHVEGIETLVATLSNCPPDTDPALGIPCYYFEIDPAHSSATIYVREDGLSTATVAITRPEDGAVFRLGEPVAIEAVAIDLDGYISRVEFFDGTEKIGESEIVFIRAPDPGTPIDHYFEWNHAAPGDHALTVRAQIADGMTITSAPVRITVNGTANQPPRVAIVRPVGGAEFPPFRSIEIVAQASDADGLVRQVAFFADDRKIGEVGWDRDQRPDPGSLQTFTFAWRHPPPGVHLLTARAIDNQGAAAISDPVQIRVIVPDGIPVVTAAARDAFAVEPGMDAGLVLNTAAFEIRRYGSIDSALTVRYDMAGEAENGVDYELVSGLAVIPAGHRSVPILIGPLADAIAEGKETVVLRLIESSGVDPATGVITSAYRIGFPGRAVAVISDRPWVHAPGEAHCIPAVHGWMHVCFSFEAPGPCLIEASRDFRTWETLLDSETAEGAAHLIDDESGAFPFRVYRLAR